MLASDIPGILDRFGLVEADARFQFPVGLWPAETTPYVHASNTDADNPKQECIELQGNLQISMTFLSRGQGITFCL